MNHYGPVQCNQCRALHRGFSELRGLDVDAEFAAQGFTSQKFYLLAEALRPMFPGLAAHHLYRFPSVHALLTGYRCGNEAAAEASGTAGAGGGGAAADVGFAAVGASCCLPGGVHSPDALWSTMESGDDMLDDHSSSASGGGGGGKLSAGSFDAAREGAALGLTPAELAVTDPQHVLALRLAREALDDAGADVKAALETRGDRVGVYIGRDVAFTHFSSLALSCFISHH
jgi:hypothetical protein